MATSVTLLDGDSQLEIIPQEGAVLADFQIGGMSFLAQTPWAETVQPSQVPAADELAWVESWRGGWQLCAPNTGSATEQSAEPAFHGAASQANWAITEVNPDSLTLNWIDSRGEIELSRRWSVSAGVVTAETTATNHSSHRKAVGFAEHLILGSHFLQPLRHGAVAELIFCPAATIVELDYSGAPLEATSQSSVPALEFSRLSVAQPAKVFALANPKNKSISVEVSGWVARIDWQGLDHALIWQEFATSTDAPWNSQVYALGIEPTNVAHGLGANDSAGPFLAAGETISWTTSLQFFRKVDESLEPAA
ncbi:MAG: hypothetical protein RLZZ345_27 [Actinomycetota bacterium]|jgi:hypothetical protein